MTEVALASGVSVDALRKIESGRVPTPALFTVAALAAALGLSLDTLVRQAHRVTSGAEPGVSSRQAG
jgi:transcriptional regulator with XRE-family HTH domain